MRIVFDRSSPSSSTDSTAETREPAPAGGPEDLGLHEAGEAFRLRIEGMDYDAFGPERLSVLESALEASDGRSARASVDGLDALFLGGRGARAPGGYSGPEVAGEASAGASVGPAGLDASLTRLQLGEDGAPERSESGAFGVSNGLSFSASSTTADQSRSGSLWVSDGFMMVSGSTDRRLSSSSALGATAGLGLSPGSVGLSLGSRLRAPTGLSSSAATYLYASADREVSDLGRYSGPLAALQGRRRVAIKRKVGGGAAPGASAVAALLGLGGSVGLDGSRELVFRTHLLANDARAVLFERGGVAAFWREKARALGRAPDALPVPPLSRPDALALGDELELQVRGSFQAALAVGGLGLSVGVQGVMAGDFEVRVTKTGNQTVELSVTPVNVRGVQLFAGLPWFLEGGVSRSKAVSLRQAFSFDLSEPGAYDAYLRALQGRLPGTDGLTPFEGGAQGLLRWIRDEKLPPGVKRTYVEHLEVQARTQGGGFKWGPLQTFSPVGGLNTLSRSSAERRMVSNGSTVLSSSARVSEQRNEVPLSGTSGLGVGARLRAITTLGEDRVERSFLGVTLTARYADNKVRGLELNRHIRRMNALFGTELGDMRRARKQKDWVITFERTFRPEDLDRLLATPPERVAAASKPTGVPLAHLLGLLEALRQSADHEAQATKLQTFVSETGLEGFAAVHRLSDDYGAPLVVQSANSVYDAATAVASLLSFKYPEPIPEDAGPREVQRRYDEVRRALELVGRAILELEDDPLLLDPRARADLALELRRAERALLPLHSLHHFSPEALAALEDALRGAWWSQASQRLVWHIAYTRKSR